MKKINKIKLFIIIASIALICSTSIGAYYAITTERANAVTNTFELGSITCDISEDFDGAKKENVAIVNTSDVGAFVRAEIIVTWMSKDGKSVYSEKPALGTDYSMTVNDSDWFVSSDGFYYYKHIVGSGDSTSNLIETAAILSTANAPTDFYLSVEIISSAIQANPTKAVGEAWAAVEWNGSELASK